MITITLMSASSVVGVTVIVRLCGSDVPARGESTRKPDDFRNIQFLFMFARQSKRSRRERLAGPFEREA
jgi:hypothetical protein